MKKSLIFLFLLSIVINSFAQDSMEDAWKHWSKANIEQADKIAQKNIATDEGKHLKGNILQVSGKYQEALQMYDQISDAYTGLEEVQISKLNINLFHMKDLEKAKSLAKGIDNKLVTVYPSSIEKSMEPKSSGSFNVPMLTTEPLNPYIPHISASINGQKQKIAFDTGANFLVLTKAAAERLGVKYNPKLFFMGKQGFGTSKMWVGTVDELILGEDIKLKNVPVTILEKMNTEIIIFGTNILKEFYTTIDYPNNQFVFTTRDKPELLEIHKKNYSGKTMPFILWGDHYMMGKGSYNGKAVNMFFDSGLVVVGQADGKIAQSWLCLSKENMGVLGIEEKESTSPLAITTTDDILKFAGIEHKNVILSESGSSDFIFGGIKCDLLVSHGIIKKYAWSIDFEKMEYIFK